MSEAHDRLIADKEAKILQLNKHIEARENALEVTKEALRKARECMTNAGSAMNVGASLLDTSLDMSEALTRTINVVNDHGSKLLQIMRDTRASFAFESVQLKRAAEEAKQFKSCASDLKAAIEILSSIPPGLLEILRKPDELTVITKIIHACKPSTPHRERSDTQASESSGPTPDVQVG